MANYVVSDGNLSTVADAIRAKGGTNEALSFPVGFVSAIEAIETSEPEEKDINLYDYDGTLLYSYTAEEAYTSYKEGWPDPPAHDGLVFQEWSRTRWDAASISIRQRTNERRIYDEKKLEELAEGGGGKGR